MTEPTVQIPLSLAVELRDDCMSLVAYASTINEENAFMAQAEVLQLAIEKAEREAALTQAAGITQSQYADTVNPLIKCDGACEVHDGPVTRVHVIHMDTLKDWGNFNYCENAIAEDEGKGFRVMIVGNELIRPQND